MKKTTKFISIALCLIICFTSVFTTAFAAAPVYGIGLTFKTDIHGESIENYKEFITIKYGEVDFYSKDGSAFNGIFEGSKSYEVAITLAPENATYYLMPSLPNGISFFDSTIAYKSHTITLRQYGTDYVTVFADVTIDEPTVFRRISDFFTSLFEKIREFFSDKFSF